MKKKILAQVYKTVQVLYKRGYFLYKSKIQEKKHLITSKA